MNSNGQEKTWIDLVPLLLTAFIAGATCCTAYLTYKSVQISAAQERRESRQEIIQILTLLRETLEYANRSSLSDSNTDLSSSKPANQIQPPGDESAD